MVTTPTEPGAWDFWQQLQNDVTTWAIETFGERGPLPSLHHLRKEADELIAAPFDLDEYADATMLLIQSAAKAGYTMEDIRVATWRKLQHNKGRKWGVPDADGVCEHIDEGESDGQEVATETAEGSPA